jgi:hypothetical protein
MLALSRRLLRESAALSSKQEISIPNWPIFCANWSMLELYTEAVLMRKKES